MAYRLLGTRLAMVKVPPPSIRKFMSTAPITVSPATSRQDALKLMHQKKIHHVPVCEAGKVVGIVSDGDLSELELAGSPKQTLKECMRTRPFVVSPETPVDEVVRTMSTQKQGFAAVVVDNGRVVGMFTATDGMRAFADFLSKAGR